MALSRSPTEVTGNRAEQLLPEAPAAALSNVRTARELRRQWAAVAALLALYAVAAISSLLQESATFDETSHLPAGLTYLDKLDFRLNPEHPPLAKAIAALPVLLLRRPTLPYGSPAFRGRPAEESDGKLTGADQWRFGYEVLNGPPDEAVRRDPARLLLPARLSIVLMGICLGLLVYALGTDLFGSRAGLGALFLFALSPAMLAHGGLVTTDLPAALGFVATLFCFRRYLSSHRIPYLLLTGLALGCALLTKFSTLLLGPLLLLYALVAVRASRLAWLRLAAAVGCICLLAYATIYAGYGFRFSTSDDPAYLVSFSAPAAPSPLIRKTLRFAHSHRLLPESYLDGLSFTFSYAQNRLGFLDGKRSYTGFKRYYPEVFLYKTPPALLGLLLLLPFGCRFRPSRVCWFLLLPPLLYFGALIPQRINIGQRHLLPIYPFLYVLAGSLFAKATGKTVRRLATLLLVGYAASFAAATPRYIGYFNFIAGGQENGWHHLVDSNVDWGQDLPALARWQRNHGGERIYLAYFGTADPAAYRISYRKLYFFYDFHPERVPQRPGPGDLVAASVTLLQGIYLGEDASFARIAIERGLVSRQEIRGYMSDASGPYRPLAEWLVRHNIITPQQRQSIEMLLPGPMLRLIRDKLKPIGRAGSSILIYRLPNF